VQTPQIPPAFVSVTDLGAPVGVYAPSPGRVALRVLIAVVWLGAAIAGMIWLRAHGQLRLPQWAWWAWVAAVAACGALLVRGAFRSGKRALVVYERGLAQSQDGSVRVWPWDQVVALNLKPVGEGAACYEAVMADGAKVSLAGVPTSLIDVVRERTFPLRYERASEPFLRGETVGFGVLAVHRATGLAYEGRTYPWPDIRDLKVTGDVLAVSTKDTSFFRLGGPQASVGQVPNIDVLQALFEQAGGRG